jgi:hypothetical protein
MRAALLFFVCLTGCHHESTPASPVPKSTLSDLDCAGSLVEVARVPAFGLHNGDSHVGALSVDGDTIFLAYDLSLDESLPMIGGGVLAIPRGGGTARVVLKGNADRVWGSGGALYAQTGTSVARFDPAAVSDAPEPAYAGLYVAYASDASFAYAAQPAGGYANPPRTKSGVYRTPLAGGDPTPLYEERARQACLGGLADAGDALLVGFQNDGEPRGRVLRVPKDGSPASEVRPDVPWSLCGFGVKDWIAWDGADVLAHVPTPDTHVVTRARVPATAGPPVFLELDGDVYAQRAGGVVFAELAWTSRERVVIASSDSPRGRALACSAEHLSMFGPSLMGIAVSGDDTYIAYSPSEENEETVIARVAP